MAFGVSDEDLLHALGVEIQKLLDKGHIHKDLSGFGHELIIRGLVAAKVSVLLLELDLLNK